MSNFPCRRGKVRDVYDVADDKLVIVSTDRISAFDQVLPTQIPGRGKILTAMSLFWIRTLPKTLNIPYHLISADLADMPEEFRSPEFEGRTMLVHKAKVIPFECVVRGYLTGGGYKEYLKTGSVSGVKLPDGIKMNMQLPRPIFTPTTKAESGHDLSVTVEEMNAVLPPLLASKLVMASIELYESAFRHAWGRGIIIADTKFEFGLVGEQLYLIDEVLTPDSSRFWALSDYWLGGNIPSYDKQIVRDWLSDNDSRELPPDVVERTGRRYIEVYETLSR